MQESYKRFAERSTEDLVLEYRRTNDEEYIEEILRRNKGLIYMWAIQYLNIPHSEADDLVSEGYIALMQAVSGFDPAMGYSFTSCLKGCVCRRLNKIYKWETRDKRGAGSVAVSYEELIGLSGGGEVRSSSEDDYSHIDAEKYLEQLQATQRTIVEYLLQGYGKVEIADLLQITPATISYYMKQIKKNYDKYLGGTNI